MDLGLRGKRALVTGGSKGIGLAIARALVSEGVSVGLVARDAGTLTTAWSAAAGDLAAAGAAATDAAAGNASVTVTTFAADVTDTAALGNAVEQVAASLGGLDFLVANAGGTVGSGNLTSAGAGDFTATFALNAGHAAELIRLGLPHLKAAGGGSVVIISSVTGMHPAPRTAYAAAKAAEIHLAATAAQELAPQNIRVNAVSPGSIMFAGGGWDWFKRNNPELFDAWLASEFPHGRLAARKKSPMSWRSCCRIARRGSPGPTSRWTGRRSIRALAVLSD